MVERLHPGVYVEERRRGVAPITGVSTSTYGTVGGTLRGPTDEAVLVSSFEQFQRTFGGFTDQSGVPLHLFAFFANGGRRAYVVRVVASDAVIADGFITSDVTEEVIETGDNVVVAFGGSLAHVPVEPSSVVITWRHIGTPVVAAAANHSPATDGVILDFAGRAVVASDMKIIPGTVTLTTTVTAAPYTYTDPAKDGLLKDGGGDVRGYIDYKTGHWSLSAETAAGLPDAATAITIGYTPEATALNTVVDNGLGALTGTSLAAPGTIDYATGVYAFTTTAPLKPADQAQVLAAYTQKAFDIDPISKGVWGNGLDVQVRGNTDAFTRLTASYAKYDVNVLLDGEVVETFLDLSFTDPNDSNYVITALNDPTQGSDLITLVDPANEAVAPASLNGKLRTRSGGSGNASNQNYGSTAAADPDGYPSIPVGFRAPALETPVQPGSVVITYTDLNGVARTITDNGSGLLIGDVDPAPPTGYNRINYTSGKFAFRTVAAVSMAEVSNLAVPTTQRPGSIITISHRKTPAATATTDDLTGGSDGVAGITRTELTNPALKADRKGMYALLTSDELLNVGIPDAAGDVTMAADQIAEAETNGKWFVILASPPGMTPQEVRDWRRFTLGISSSYGGLYYPYIRVTDPFTERGSNIPPIGHIAGVYARTDTNKNVSKAPAGVEDGKLLFTVGLERRLEFGEIDTFFQSQVNAIVDTTQTGRAVWGARTLENPPDDFRYIQVRRMFNFLKSSIFNGTHGFVFENVGASLRQRIQLSVESFLRNLFNQGYFAGSVFTDAVVVICDESNNTSDNEEAGEVFCDIYIAPNRPGEFIIFRIQQKFSSAA